MSALLWFGFGRICVGTLFASARAIVRSCMHCADKGYEDRTVQLLCEKEKTEQQRMNTRSWELAKEERDAKAAAAAEKKSK